MNTKLRVALFALMSLAGCCSDDDRDCTVDELAAKNEQAAWVEKHTTTPELVSETGGVRLYRIWTVEPSSGLENHWTYFTTPCGDVNAELTWQESYGKLSETRHQQLQTAGGGCQ